MRALLALTAVLALAASAGAQQLTLSFQDGLVSIRATDVPVRTILSEWSRLGGTEVVNAEKVAGAPITIQLDDVPEARALEIILRNVAGYMTAPRRAANGASLYDRILVMPTSSAPAPAAASARPGGSPATGTERAIPRRTFEDLANGDTMSAEEVDANVNQPAFAFPQPDGSQQNIFQPVGQSTPFGTPISPGMGQQPFISLNPNDQSQSGVVINPTAQPPAIQFPNPFQGQQPGEPGQQPATGFGVVGAPMPGVVVQPPPPPGTRPPGGA